MKNERVGGEKEKGYHKLKMLSIPLSFYLHLTLSLLLLSNFDIVMMLFLA